MFEGMLEDMSKAPPTTPQEPPKLSNFITEIIDQDLEHGKYTQIVTRFPPEPSGYAHLGHIFASALSFRTAQQYGGRFHLRMDDSNPELATQEYVDAIADDLRWLGLEWGEQGEYFYYASDYFEKYYQYAEQLIKQGDAYVDSISSEEMARLRGDSRTAGTPSVYRARSTDENLDLFRRMRAGEFPDGSHVLRAKIDLASPNIKLRDPVLYRILRATHYRQGDAWCIYPMYDFQHPLQDAIEGISHSMCSLEFIDNRAIYDWLMEKLNFQPRPHQYEFGRRGLEYTVTSKRKLRKLIAEDKVSGWDDPRMPTLRAQRRLGVTPEAIHAFARSIGVSRTNRTVDLVVYENAVRDDLNHRAPRVMAVVDPVKVTLQAAEARQLSLPYWPHDVVRDSPDGLVALPSGERVDPQEAVRVVPFDTEIYIEREDFSQDPPKGFKRLTLGGTVRLRGAGIIRADEIETDEAGKVTHIRATWLGEGAKAKGVIHWVSAKQAVAAEFRLYDRLFRVADPEQTHETNTTNATNATNFTDFLNPDSLQIKHGFVESSVLSDPAETRYQFERQGYFWRDPLASREEALVFGRIITLKDTWADTLTDQKSEPNRGESNGKSKGNTRKSEVKSAQAKQTQTKPAQAKSAPKATSKALPPAMAELAQKLVQLGASEGDAHTIAQDSTLVTFLENAVQDESYGQVASWTVNELVAELRAGSVQINAAGLAPLARAVKAGQFPMRVAREALSRSAQSGQDPLEIIEREGLNVGLSSEALNAVVAEVLAAHTDKVETYRSGKTSVLGFFTGQVMRATQGKADPKEVAAALKRALE